MKKIMEKISYDLYLVLLLVLTFLSFIGILTDYLLPLFIIIGIAAIFTKRNVLQIIPIAFFIQMSYGGIRDNVSVTATYGIVLSLLIVLDVLKNRKITRKGYLFIPLVALSILAMITGVNNTEFTTTFYGWVQIFSIFALYFYFINTLESKEENYIILSKLFMYLSLLVTIEMLYFALSSDLEVIDVIRNRSIDLGWENLNIIIYSNLVAIPLIGYLVLKAKYKLPYMILASFSVLGILMTLSRSSILTLAVYGVILIPLILFLEKEKVKLIIQGLFFLMFLSIGLYLLEQNEIVSDYYLILTNRDLYNYDDRLVLLEIAWEQFKLFPIIGSGGLYSTRFIMESHGNGAINYHNTIAQASTLGVLGLIAFTYLFFLKTKLILMSQSQFKWFVLVLIYITAFVNGMLQPMYFYASYMLFIFLIIASIEVNVFKHKSIMKPKKKS